jgi:hypothetical protein
MPRPDFITNEDIIRWSNYIEEDKFTPPDLLKSAIIREVCYSGLWLSEQLEKLQCPDSIIVRIQWTAGKLSYGRDPWEVHQEMLKQYQDNTLVFESDDSAALN